MGRGKPLWILSADRRGLTDLARVRRGRFRWSRLEIMRVHGRALELAARFGINAMGDVVETLGRAAIAKMHDRPWGEESWEPIGRALVDAHAAGRAEMAGEFRVMVENRLRCVLRGARVELRALLAQLPDDDKPGDGS